MENSIKPSYEQGECGDGSKLISLSLGMGLFWACFFMFLFSDPLKAEMAVVDSFAPPVPAALCLGFIVADLIIFKWCDFCSKERGHLILLIAVAICSTAPMVSYLVQTFYSQLAAGFLLFFVWTAAGVGLGCLLGLWSELLINFVKGFASKVLSISVVLGALFFFIASSVPNILGSILLFLAPLASLLLLKLLEREIIPVAFVSREESIKRHRLSIPIDVLNALYSAVFGLAIYMLSKVAPSLLFSAGVAVSLGVGALFMIRYLGKNTDKMMHGKTQKILFPILVIGLLPMPFVGETLRIACMLIILMGFVWLTLVCLDSTYCLIKKYRVSPFYLVSRGRIPVMLGVLSGYSIGYLISITKVVNDDMLAIISLGFVVALSLYITIVPFDKDYLADEHLEPSKQSADESFDQEGVGPWKRRCALVAKEYQLSAREMEVFNLLAKGRGASYIQGKLYISQHTVKSHTYRIYRKMNISSREELISLIESAKGDVKPDNS